MFLVELEIFLSDLISLYIFLKSATEYTSTRMIIFIFNTLKKFMPSCFIIFCWFLFFITLIFCEVVLSTLCTEMLCNKGYGKPRPRQAKILYSIQEELDLPQQYINNIVIFVM